MSWLTYLLAFGLKTLPKKMPSDLFAKNLLHKYLNELRFHEKLMIEEFHQLIVVIKAQQKNPGHI